ncbi:hypothetical protein [Sulfitobacter sp. MF3-043]|uniref:hypothetical protein n=1 Tax=Sulfitobacter sediminivivens TaxID=3252902 RepID=UPI0036DD06BB
MQLNEFYTIMGELDAGSRAKILAQLEAGNLGQDSHSEWLVNWRKASEAACDAPDDSEEEAMQHDAAQALSILLATTPATNAQDLIAQIEWFKEDMGQYVFGNAAPAHDKIFDTLLKSVRNIGGEAAG